MTCVILVRYSICLIHGGKNSLAEAASARRWLDELKALPLGSSDLDVVRAELVGHILALADFAPVRINCLGGRECSCGSAPVQPDGSALVSWQSSERQPSQVSLREGDSTRQFSEAQRSCAITGFG